MLEALALADLCALGADAAAATRLAELLALGVEIPVAAAAGCGVAGTDGNESLDGVTERGLVLEAWRQDGRRLSGRSARGDDALASDLATGHRSGLGRSGGLMTRCSPSHTGRSRRASATSSRPTSDLGGCRRSGRRDLRSRPRRSAADGSASDLGRAPEPGAHHHHPAGAAGRRFRPSPSPPIRTPDGPIRSPAADDDSSSANRRPLSFARRGESSRHPSAAGVAS